MRKVKILFLALVSTLVFATSALAFSDGLSPESNLRSEIIELIAQPDLSILDGQNMDANLRLMINENNELIVIDSGTNNKQLDNYIKSKLNYKKIKSTGIDQFSFYFVRISFEEN